MASNRGRTKAQERVLKQCTPLNDSVDLIENPKVLIDRVLIDFTLLCSRRFEKKKVDIKVNSKITFRFYHSFISTTNIHYRYSRLVITRRHIPMHF